MAASDKTDDLLSSAKKAFQDAEDAESENRERAEEDIRFARLFEQWPEEILKQREREGRPALTVPRLQTFIRQVVNDARQNKPSIKVKPVDSGADPDTAEIFNGIIRNIEAVSSADIAYDTAVDNAVSGGFGYWRVEIDWAHDDSFDQDIRITQVPDPFCVYGDPRATSADGSDWMCAFVVERMSHAEFERRYPKANKVGWSATEEYDPLWRTEDDIQVAEYWKREEVEREIVGLSDGSVMAIEDLDDDDVQMDLTMRNVTIDPTKTRVVKTYKVKQYIITDSEVLEENDWPGRYIPIVPVYGDEVNLRGRRHFFSLIHPAVDSQRMFNYWRTQATEMIALAPKVPFIGPKGSFVTDAEKWATINTQSHAYVEYDDKGMPPQRQMLDTTAVGAIQQAATAQDDMKSVLGIFDAALGAQGNETSGRAIIARQREGDTSTFHFIDNLTRSIRQSGRIVLDLIPHVWNSARVARLLGEDGTVTEQPVNQQVPAVDPKTGQPMVDQNGQQAFITYDLTVGKYDLTATAGPSFTTKREETANQMIELIRAVPDAAPLVGDLLVKNLDWQGADEIADRLKAMLPPQVQGQGGGIPPEVQQMIQQGQQAIQQLQAENEQLKADRQAEQAKMQIEAQKAAQEQQAERANLQLEAKRLQVEMFKAETDRMKVISDAQIDLNDQRFRFAQPNDLNGQGPQR